MGLKSKSLFLSTSFWFQWKPFYLTRRHSGQILCYLKGFSRHLVDNKTTTSPNNTFPVQKKKIFFKPPAWLIFQTNPKTYFLSHWTLLLRFGRLKRMHPIVRVKLEEQRAFQNVCSWSCSKLPSPNQATSLKETLLISGYVHKDASSLHHRLP